MFCKAKSGCTQLSLLMGCMLLACGSTLAQDVHYNFMPGTDFSKYHTYKWITIPANVHPNQIVSEEIKQAIDNQLTAKGLMKADGEKADLYVGYQCSIDQERQWNGFGMGGFRWNSMGTLTSSTIDNGTLVVDMYDPATKQLIWTGRASKTLNSSGNQEKDVETLNKAMAKLLKNYPPKT